MYENNIIVFFLVAKFAKEKIEPRVKEMEKLGDIPQDILKEFFDNGVC
jgi:hypothetical protein